MTESASRRVDGHDSDLSVSVKTSLLPHTPLAGCSRSTWRQAVHTDSHVNLELNGSLVNTFDAMPLSRFAQLDLVQVFAIFVSQGGHHSALGQIVKILDIHQQRVVWATVEASSGQAIQSSRDRQRESLS